MLWGSYSFLPLGKGLEVNLIQKSLLQNYSSMLNEKELPMRFTSLTQARVYEIPNQKVCAAFLTNTLASIDTTVKFRGVDYFLPHHSISIVPDCRTVVFNTQRVKFRRNCLSKKAY